MSYYRQFDEDEDNVLNSEVLWTFKNFKKEVLDSYPNGRCISEQLLTIGGESTWKIDFYPNGKDVLTLNKIVIVITLVKSNDRSLLSQIEAECNYRFLNISSRVNYAGTINRQKFKSFVSAQDSSFDSKIFYDNFTNQNDNDFKIAIQITQFLASNNNKLNNTNEQIRYNNTVRSMRVDNNLDDDFQKMSVNPLY